MIVDRILANWQVKLVALFLAVALWFYTSGQASVEHDGLTVKVPDSAVQGLPTDYQVIQVSPRDFTIDVSGPLTVLREVRAEITPALVIAASALERGQQEFSITDANLGLPADVRILRTNPDIREVVVTFGKVVREPFSVLPPDLEDIPPGFDPVTRLEVSRVDVRGPRAALATLRERSAQLRPDPISLRDIDPKQAQTRSERVQLHFDLPGSVHLEEAVFVAIDLKPTAAARQVSLPVQLLVPRDFFHRFDLELSQPQVAVTLRGPKNLLDELKADDLTAYLNLRRSIDPGATQELPVQLIGPPWLTWEPVTIRVTAVLAAKPASPPRPDKDGQ